VEDGTMLYVIKDREASPLPLDENTKFRFDIAIDESTVGECEPVVPLLTQLRGTVNEVIDLIAPVLTE
jgi:hypothetical protein